MSYYNILRRMSLFKARKSRLNGSKTINKSNLLKWEVQLKVLITTISAVYITSINFCLAWIGTNKLSISARWIKMKYQPFMIICFLMSRSGFLISRKDLRIVISHKSLAKGEVSINKLLSLKIHKEPMRKSRVTKSRMMKSTHQRRSHKLTTLEN